MQTGRRIEYDEYGAADVLHLVPQPRPTPMAGEVLVEVIAAGISHMDGYVRAGTFTDQVPLTFPATSGSCFAGIVRARGRGVPKSVGTEVLGHDPKAAAHASWVVVPADAVIQKPSGITWEIAGGLYLAGLTALETIRALRLTRQDVVIVTAAAGGVGHLQCQLARLAGAMVIGIAATENHDYLRSLGVIPVAHGDDLQRRLRTAAEDRNPTAFIDNHGSYDGFVSDSDIPSGRFVSSADRGRIELRHYLASGSDPRPAVMLHDLIDLIGTQGLRPLTSGFYDFEHVQEALADLDSGHSRGKVVIGMHTAAPAVNYLGSKLRALQAQRLA